MYPGNVASWDRAAMASVSAINQHTHLHALRDRQLSGVLVCETLHLPLQHRGGVHKMELVSNSAVEPPVKLAADVEGNPLTGMPEDITSILNCTQRVGEHIDGQTVMSGRRSCQAQLDGNEFHL